ncbi:MAG: rod shape-determining protein RodA [Pseudomonadota bacterium]|jgi:rod shape determining protein RodA
MKTPGPDFVRRLPENNEQYRQKKMGFGGIKIDAWLLLGLLAIGVFGLTVLYSASGHSNSMMERQLVFFILAYGVMLAIGQIRLAFMERWALWLYGLGIILLILTLVIGVGAKGAQRWISLGFTRFQPAEVLKIAVPLTVAAYFSHRHLPPKLIHVFICMVIILVPSILILKQPDLGTAILVSVSGVIGLFLAGLRWRYILLTLAIVGAAAWPMWNYVMHDYQKKRILTLIDPDADKWGAGWNILQSKTAIGSGGIDGKGWMKGTQSQLDFLPESHTDFIIAVLAEEFGLRGVLALLCCYTFVIGRGLIIAWGAATTFGRIVAGSISLTFLIYVFVNMAMVSGLLPIVGVPLPMVSLGGTSLITLMMSFGILMAVANERKR